jgi:hypothetical protein
MKPYNLHKMSYTPEYQVYQTAKDRCTNPKSQRWHSHGGRGIEMRFTSFNEFFAHIGPRPSKEYSLERINNDGHYEAGNVKWATRSEQQLNKRSYSTKVRHGRGYYWHKLSQKWCVRIKHRGKTIYLDLFDKDKEEDAAKAYNDAYEKIAKEEQWEKH